MATYTTNLSLKKPDQSDKIRIADINGNMDDVDAAFGAIGTSSVATQLGKVESGIAIVSVGNVHGAIAAGEFVYVRGHGTLAEGLYTANSAISTNGSLTSSNLTAVSGGGLNAVNNMLISPEELTGIESNRTSLTINAVSAFRIGKLVIANIRFTTTESTASALVLIKGMPKVDTTLSSGNSVGGIATNNSGAVLSLMNSGSPNTGAIATSATLAAGIYCVTAIYIAQ